MERKNQHNRNQIEQEKRKHQKEFDRERASGDFKEQRNNSINQRNRK